MKHVILGCSMLALIGATAVAQDTLTSAVATEATQQNLNVMLELDDIDVVSAEGAFIGEVEEVLVDGDGRLASFVVEVGGFLGMAEREVAVPIDAFEFRGGQYVSKMTKAQLENLPVWD